MLGNLYTARFVDPVTVGRGGLHHGTDAHARAQAQSADITVTVCGAFTLNSGRQSPDKEQWEKSVTL